MAITLTDHVWPEKLVKSGAEEGLILTGGEHLKVETTPAGIEILDAVVPVGKQWVPRIIVELVETDA